jgi:hypothetical protein
VPLIDGFSPNVPRIFKAKIFADPQGVDNGSLLKERVLKKQKAPKTNAKKSLSAGKKSQANG